MSPSTERQGSNHPARSLASIPSLGNLGPRRPAGTAPRCPVTCCCRARPPITSCRPPAARSDRSPGFWEPEVTGRPRSRARMRRPRPWSRKEPGARRRTRSRQAPPRRLVEPGDVVTGRTDAQGERLPPVRERREPERHRRASSTSRSPAASARLTTVALLGAGQVRIPRATGSPSPGPPARTWTTDRFRRRGPRRRRRPPRRAGSRGPSPAGRRPGLS